MINYRGNSPEYMRRQNCGCNQAPTPAPYSSFRPAPNPECTKTNDELAGMPLAMAYVPWQVWKCPYEVEKAIHCGTIFEQLYKPFKGAGGGCR